jgi:hypothetical protein
MQDINFRIEIRKIILSGVNKNFLGLETLMKHKRRLRRLWQVTRNQACKRVVNWVAETIRRMTSRKALELWEMKVGNCEDRPPILGNCLWKRMDQSHQRLFMDFGNNMWSEKESQWLRIVKKTSSHLTTCVSDGWSSPRICRQHPVGKSKTW